MSRIDECVTKSSCECFEDVEDEGYYWLLVLATSLRYYLGALYDDWLRKIEVMRGNINMIGLNFEPFVLMQATKPFRKNKERPARLITDNPSR